MLNMSRTQLWSMGAAACLAGVAFAQVTPPDYGFQWSTIGDVGNRDTNDDEVFVWTGTRRGAVDYEYRMATTEVTVGQWFEFVEAYKPYYFQNTGYQFANVDFTGGYIVTATNESFIVDDASPNQPTNMSWEYAARYVNWLHNGKVVEEWAFESGVYDTSTFTQNPDGTYNHQIGHNPDADFWIPTIDEWTKAAYWDPDKNNGEGGYWKFQNGSDIEPLLRTERNAGFGGGLLIDVGMFPDVQSPWGILDMAGGMSEWSGTAGAENRVRTIFGTDFFASYGYGDPFTIDQVGWNSSGNMGMAGFTGLRLVSRVPSPGAMWCLRMTAVFICRRSR